MVYVEGFEIFYICPKCGKKNNTLVEIIEKSQWINEVGFCIDESGKVSLRTYYGHGRERRYYRCPECEEEIFWEDIRKSLTVKVKGDEDSC